MITALLPVLYNPKEKEACRGKKGKKKRRHFISQLYLIGFPGGGEQGRGKKKEEKDSCRSHIYSSFHMRRNARKKGEKERGGLFFFLNYRVILLLQTSRRGKRGDPKGKKKKQKRQRQS